MNNQASLWFSQPWTRMVCAAQHLPGRLLVESALFAPILGILTVNLVSQNIWITDSSVSALMGILVF